MTYQIDQSGKVENTEKDTFLCISNGKFVIACIRRGIKRELQKLFRTNNRGRDFVIFTFSALISIVVEEFDRNELIIIDTEYPGKNHIIKKLIIEMGSEEKQLPDMHFGFVGKNSACHKKAYLCSRGMIKNYRQVTSKELIEKIKKTEAFKSFRMLKPPNHRKSA